MQTHQTIGERFRHLVKAYPALWKLLLINAIVWLFLSVVQLVGFLTAEPGTAGDAKLLAEVVKWLGVPASTAVLASRPWTVISYMFVHEELMHLFFNMLWLYWFGKIYMEFKPGTSITLLYLLGGVAGALFFILAYNIFPVFQQSLPEALAIGASASVLAVTVATAVLVPGYNVNLLFLGPVKIKYIAAFVVILDVLMLRQGNAGGHFAHLGGAVAGIAYGFFQRSSWYARLGLADFFRKVFSFRKKRKMRSIHYTAKPLTDEEYNLRKAQNQKKTDHILDKISRSGYSSLSAAEKEFLFNSSSKNP